MPTLQPRDAIWPGQLPTNTNGTPRPLLALDRPILTIHYTGSPVNYGDSGDTAVELAAIQQWAMSAGKPWEYNYVVDTDGVAWEYAGWYRAAHSAGNNDRAVGVLLLLGTSNPPTAAMIETVRWLRWLLTGLGLLAENVETIKHKDMGTTITTCPGPLVDAAWSQFLEPWIESELAEEPDPTPAPTPAPPDEEMDDMIKGFMARRARDGQGFVVDPWLRHATPFDINSPSWIELWNTGQYIDSGVNESMKFPDEVLDRIACP